MSRGDVKKVEIFIILKKGNFNKLSYMEILKLYIQFCQATLVTEAG